MPSNTVRPTSSRARERLLDAWRAERHAAQEARASGDRSAEWNHLERAHILSQPMAIPHVRTHVWMLTYGIRHRDSREIRGQLFRLVVAGPGSLTNRYPVGNTGGADIGARVVLPLPADLREILQVTP